MARLLHTFGGETLPSRDSTTNRRAASTSVAEDDLLVLLTHAMEAIPSAAFITNGDGLVLFSNGEGRRLLSHPGRTRDEIREAANGDSSAPFTVSRIAGRAGRERRLLVRRPSVECPESPSRVAATTWGLSRRQAEVLALVVEGHPNASIAQLLGIALRTVEVHMTAILARAGVENRSSLVARALGGTSISRA